MTFGELMAATGLARPDSPVRIRFAERVLDIGSVEIPLDDLDEGKRLGDTAEGHARGELVVWLVATEQA